jgi:hypothetical protein
MANTTGKKFGGRKAGTPNRSTSEIKEMINQFISGNIQDLQVNYDSLEPEKKLQFFKDLLKYTIPTHQSNEININTMSDLELDTLCNKLLNKLNDNEITID